MIGADLTGFLLGAGFATVVILATCSLKWRWTTGPRDPAVTMDRGRRHDLYTKD